MTDTVSFNPVENRSLIRQITNEILAGLDSSEALFADDLFDSYFEHAVDFQFPRPGSSDKREDIPLGLGDESLLIVFVIPLVINILTEIFKKWLDKKELKRNSLEVKKFLEQQQITWEEQLLPILSDHHKVKKIVRVTIVTVEKVISQD